METTAQRLRYVLQVLAPAVGGKKATLPILQNVVIGQGRAYALNLETAVTVEFPEAIDDPLLLPHQQVLSLLRHIPGPTRLSINREGEFIKLTAGATSADFPVPGKVAEFPPLPKLQPVGEGQVDGDLFLKTATALAPYAATDVSRPVLRCVCVTLGAPLEMAAGDGFRLAWQTVPMALPTLGSPPTDLKQLLLPTAAVHILARVWKLIEKQPTVDAPQSTDPLKKDGDFRMAMLSVAKRMATVRFTRTALSFEHGGVVIRVQLAQGEFPNYHQLIPTDLPNKVSFDAEEALRAIKSLEGVAADGSGIVRLSWSDGSLRVSATSEEFGAVGARIRTHIQGSDGRIAFNIKYLTDYLVGKLGMVLLETSAPSTPGRFYHSGSPDVLVMPMFVTDPAAPTTEGAAGGPADAEAPVDEETPTEPAAAEPSVSAKQPRARARRASAKS